MVADTPAHRPTLALVSKEAGVSMATVSKVLNGRPDVSPDTRAKVEQLLRKHQYVPPANSRRARPPARVIDLVFDDILNPYASEILRGVTTAALGLGVDVVVGHFPALPRSGPIAAEDSWAQRLVAAGREGVIVVTSELTSAQIAGFERAGLPLVVIDPLNLPRSDVASVGATNWTGGLTATEHLIGLGHRRIGFLGGPPSASCGQARLHGYLAALNNAGITSEQELIRNGHFTFRTGHELGLVLLQLPNRPTAVFTACEPIAFGLIEAARELGLTVPDQLSIVGFDDTYAAEWSTPPLTTIRQPLQEMGHVAVRTLLRLQAGEALESHHVELATQLVIRSSTAPATQL